MLKPEKGKKVVHFRRKQRTMTFSGSSSLDIDMKLDAYIEENTCRSEAYGMTSETKVFVDSLCFSFRTEQIHGTTHFGADLNVDNHMCGIAVLHLETWMLTNDDYPEDEPDIVDVKYYEGGWM